MTDWVKTKLGEVVDLAISAVQVEPHARYDIVGVLNRGRGLLYRDAIMGAETSYKTLNRVGPNQVVYSRLKAFEGAITVASATLPEVYASQEFPTFDCGPSLLPGFFRLLTTTQRMWDALQNLSTGMGGRRERVKPADFLTLPICLPSLAEQRRIVDVMASLDAQIEALEVEVARSGWVIVAARRDLLEPRDEWMTVAMGELISFAGGYAFPEKFQGQAAGEWPFVKCSDMNRPENRRIMSTAANWVDSQSRSALRAKSWPIGTVIFPKVGAALLTEKRRMLSVEACFDNNVMGLVAGSRIRSGFLFEVMSTVRLGDLAQHGAVPSVNQTHIDGIHVSLPPLEAQDEIVRVMSVLHEAYEAAHAEVATLHAVRSTLLASLLSQDVEIPEFDDAVLASGMEVVS